MWSLRRVTYSAYNMFYYRLHAKKVLKLEKCCQHVVKHISHMSCRVGHVGSVVWESLPFSAQYEILVMLGIISTSFTSKSHRAVQNLDWNSRTTLSTFPYDSVRYVGFMSYNMLTTFITTCHFITCGRNVLNM